MTELNEIMEITEPDALHVPDRLTDSRRFAPKLSFEERCQVLAACVYGINRDAVAKGFGVNRRTVHHIQNESSKSYRSVRREMERLGKDEFLKRHLKQFVIDRIDEAWTRSPDGPSKRAVSMEGYHTIRPDHCARDHRIEVGWCVLEGCEGWYYSDLEQEPADWLGGDDGPFRTSRDAYEYALENVED